MIQKDIIKVGDRFYDAVTGLPVEEPTPSNNVEQNELPAVPSAPKVVRDSARVSNNSHANQLHSKPGKSRTLHRSSVTKPQPSARPAEVAEVAKAPAVAPVKRQASTYSQIHRSPQVSRFAPSSIDGVRPRQPRVIEPIAAPQPTVVADKPTVKPVVAPVAPKPAQQKPVVSQSKTPAEIKNSAIEAALQNAKTPSTKAHKSKKRKTSRIASFATAGIAVLLLAGYVSYLTMPSISLRVAAAQAGIDASYPQYHPDGYRPGGAITFAPGEVHIPFSSNGSDAEYVVSQKKSNWDSNAVKQYVEDETGDTLAYSTETERGLVIYTYGGNAAWVNGGVLYTISGDANLSNDQIRRIATSL